MKNLIIVGLITLTTFVAKSQAIVPFGAGGSLYSPNNGGARILWDQGNTAAHPAIGFHSTSGQIGNDDGAGGNGIFRPLANTMAFSTQSLERMRITPGGSIGMGTSSPVAGLHVLGNTGVRFERNDGSNQTNALAIMMTSNGLPSPTLPAGTINFISKNLTPGALADMTFSANNAIHQFIIKHNGNIGINNTSPLLKLTINTASQNDGIMVNQTGTTAATLSLVGGGPVGAGAGQSRRWALHSTGPGNFQGAGHLFFWDWTTNIERMRIHQNGNVGINTVGACGGIPMAKLHVNGTVYIGAGCFTPCSTTVKMPLGYKLYVEDGILTEKVKVAVKTNCNWADHVFASDYKLQPLSEVESFIEKNNHLPGIPSANTLVAEGLDLGEMQAKQMEKIEELTLYMIEMKKEIDELKKENQVLKSSSNNKN